jgi:hypothetical protein
MEAQGYKVRDNILFQDNMSSDLLEKNGKDLSSQRTKHINIRCFFISNRVNKGEVSVVWCPTGNMIADYATKPLQGALFCKFRYQIMGVVKLQDPGLPKPKPKMGKIDNCTQTPRKGKQSDMVPPQAGQHHRSVLREPRKPTEDRLSKVMHCLRWDDSPPSRSVIDQ